MESVLAVIKQQHSSTERRRLRLGSRLLCCTPFPYCACVCCSCSRTICFNTLTIPVMWRANACIVHMVARDPSCQISNHIHGVQTNFNGRSFVCIGAYGWYKRKVMRHSSQHVFEAMYLQSSRADRIALPPVCWGARANWKCNGLPVVSFNRHSVVYWDVCCYLSESSSASINTSRHSPEVLWISLITSSSAVIIQTTKD